MVGEITIRQIGAGDWATFKTLRLESLQKAPIAYAMNLQDGLAMSDDDWRKSAASRPMFLAFNNDEAIGMMGYFPNPARNTKHRAMLVSVYVKEELRSKGLGAKLLEHLEAHARAQGFLLIELAVNMENQRARRFYQRAGYAHTGILPKACFLEGGFTDEILMHKIL